MEAGTPASKSKFCPTDLVALLILAAGGIRIFGYEEWMKRLDKDTLLYLCAAAAVFLLKHMNAVKIPNIIEFERKLENMKGELHDVKEEAKEARLVAGIAGDAPIVNLPPVTDVTVSNLHTISSTIQPGDYANDPWKGVFGGKSVDPVKGRRLAAQVEPLSSSPGWYSVTLTVTNTEGAPPVTGDVQFFIHDTFLNSRPLVRAVNGSAVLRLKAWGAFTTGVLADNGETKLELDLADLETAPMEFRER